METPLLSALSTSLASPASPTSPTSPASPAYSPGSLSASLPEDDGVESQHLVDPRRMSIYDPDRPILVVADTADNSSLDIKAAQSLSPTFNLDGIFDGIGLAIEEALRDLPARPSPTNKQANHKKRNSLLLRLRGGIPGLRAAGKAS